MKGINCICEFTCIFSPRKVG